MRIEMSQYKPETIVTFKKMYSERKETIDYLEKFGNLYEKAQAMLIKSVAIKNSEDHPLSPNF